MTYVPTYIPLIAGPDPGTILAEANEVSYRPQKAVIGVADSSGFSVY